MAAHHHQQRACLPHDRRLPSERRSITFHHVLFIPTLDFWPSAPGAPSVTACILHLGTSWWTRLLCPRSRQDRLRVKDDGETAECQPKCVDPLPRHSRRRNCSTRRAYTEKSSSRFCYPSPTPLPAYNGLYYCKQAVANYSVHFMLALLDPDKTISKRLTERTSKMTGLQVMSFREALQEPQRGS